MPQHTWDELQLLARETIGAELFMATGLGATETSPFAIGGNIGMTGAGVVGLPSVGLQLKLVPNEGKMEARVKGPNVTPGYWRQPELTKKAYDEEGYYKLGDALRFFDPEDPSKGLVFDGRVTEDFKLTTGTWVSVGPLKLKLIEHFGGLIKDAVITGLDQDYLGALLIPDPEACATLADDLPKLPTFDQIAAHPVVRARFRDLLTSLAARSTGSSTRIAKAMIFESPPSIDAGEITDKGSINQGAVQKNRPEMVAAIYARTPDPRVLEPERQPA
jgi:feruloyl-CoA synthase